MMLLLTLENLRAQSGAMNHPELTDNPQDPTDVHNDFVRHLTHIAQSIEVRSNRKRDSLEIQIDEECVKELIELLIMQHTVGEIRHLLEKTRREGKIQKRELEHMVACSGKSEALTEKNRALIFRMILLLMKHTYRQALQEAEEEECQSGGKGGPDEIAET